MNEISNSTGLLDGKQKYIKYAFFCALFSQFIWAVNGIQLKTYNKFFPKDFSLNSLTFWRSVPIWGLGFFFALKNGSIGSKVRGGGLTSVPLCYSTCPRGLAYMYAVLWWVRFFVMPLFSPFGFGYRTPSTSGVSPYHISFFIPVKVGGVGVSQQRPLSLYRGYKENKDFDRRNRLNLNRLQWCPPYNSP